MPYTIIQEINPEERSKMGNKKFYSDIILNIVASGLPIAALQLVVYPLLSRKMDADTYGLMIAIYSLIILIADSLGKSVNNIRLIRNDEEKNRKGDYNPIVFTFAVVGVISVVVGVLYYNRHGSISTFQMILLALTAFLYVANAYLIVFFRIRLNYVAIFINAVFMSAGIILGYFAFAASENWVYVFLLAHLIQFIYLAKSTDLLKEPFKKTDSFKPVMLDSIWLALSMVLAQGMIQADKLLLLPMLGGTTVAVYYTATITGKVVSLAMGPINSVILTYIAGRDSLSKRQFRKYFLMCFLACAAISVVMLAISRPVLGFLFPKYVDGAMGLIVYTTINVFLYTLAGLMTPIVMRYCDVFWQIVINGAGVVCYIVLAVVFLKWFGIIGFCVGIGVSHLLRLLLMLWIYSNNKILVKKEK